MKHFMYPKNDLIFKLLFGDMRNLEFLSDFLQATLDLPTEEYESIEILNPYELPDIEGGKLSILDVKLRLKSGKVVDIEIQVSVPVSLSDRVVYYSAKMISEQLVVGDQYDQLRKVINILITDEPLKLNQTGYHNVYHICDPKTGVHFSELMEIHTLELPKLPIEDDGTPLWEWMKFLNANSKEDLKMIAEKNETIKKAVSALEKISEDQKARWEYDNRQKWLWDQKARESEALAKGREEGLAQGAAKERLRALRNLMESTSMSAEQAMKALKIPESEMQEFL
ncbi:MAG: Rpn family recombination-promoting nuclease/putative transposase [Clostridium sp.]|nr:Rpn family recombination-promoting nuclease/putative transposase [Clostridium sp.]